MEQQNNIQQNELINLSKFDNDIINICKYLEGEIGDNLELKKENLLYYFSNKEIYNQKYTKLKDKEDYITLINIINEFLKEKKDFIFLYFKKIDIDIIKLIFNGYIFFDISSQNDLILTTIKNLLPLFFSKEIFYLIYNKFSKIFRTFNLVVNKEIYLEKFCKTFVLWKIIYNIDNREKTNRNYFTLIGKKVLVLMNLKNRNKYIFKEVYIKIEFEEDINIINGINSELIYVCYLEYGSFNLKCKDIKKEKETIKNILIKINEESVNYILNKDFNSDNNVNENFIQVFKLDSPSNFAQIGILKNYIGKIQRILIKVEFNNEKIPKYEYEIIPKENKQGFEINAFEEKEGIIKLSFELEKKTKLISSKIYRDILYEDIKNYGGLECFIPIIKIIKYFIIEFKENENKIKKLNEILIDIIRYIINFIFISENNYKNFKKILIPLIAALAEINHEYTKAMKENLYSNSIFSLLYIIIISASLPFAIKKSFIKITEIYYINQLNLNFDEFIIDVNQLHFNSYIWYTTALISIIEFILLKFNDKNKIPKTIINQIKLLQEKIEEIQNSDLVQIKDKTSSYIKCSIQIMNYISTIENEENFLFENCDKIEDISEFLKNNFINNEDNMMLIITMIKVYLNIINLESYWFKFNEEKEKEEINELNTNKENNKYNNIFKNFFNNLEKIFNNETSNEIKNIIINTFEDYATNKDFLIKIFPFLNSCNFKLEAEIILSELTDFHRGYHNLMKNIFIFNKLWSDKKLFFNSKKKEKYLKYKSINYYTKNYQRPLIFPFLDYKSSYPNFTKFVIKEDFYIEKENPDIYDFNLNCPELDEFNLEYEKEILNKIKDNTKINSFDVCMVKRTHHIKGKLFICSDNYSLLKKIIFYSYPKNIEKNIPCCNVQYKHLHNSNKKNENLCFGAIFTCPEKNMNIKTIINVKDIRMVLRKIYFYRKSAVEIFTNNKSYFFNFADKTSKQSEKNCSDFTNMFGFFISEFFPIAINKEIIGHSRQFEAILKSYENKEKKYDISTEGNKFISSLFDHWLQNINNVEFSTLDLLIYLNLLSNRSYNDLFQYPVFPLLFFYDRIKEGTYIYLERKLNKHIGFQDVTEKAKTRKRLIKEAYISSLKEFEETEDEEMDTPSYFSTHFSNNIYISNFMVRMFPYSFLAIEQQGSGFDVPNRLFYSIEDTLFNISFAKSDLRELIPEFYYFPEIFWNLNKINFQKRENGKSVDNVEMPHDMTKLDIKEKEKNKDRISINLNDAYESSDYFRSFKFVEKIRNVLESKQTDIISWINIIFGPRQKYKDPKEEDLYFRYESYIDYTDNKKNELKFYRHDMTSMTSVEFGITPMQIVFEGDTGKIKNKNYIYNANVKDNKELFKKICKVYTDQIKPKNDKENKEKISINKEELNKNGNIIYYSKGLYKLIDTSKEKKPNPIIENKPQINNIFLSPESHINCIFQYENIKIIGYKTGKIEIFKSKENNKYDLISEIFDHKDEIIYINYNERLNMICTSSKDGFINIYSLPNKLVTTIQNSNKKTFGPIYLSSNPFPSIIALEQESFELFSYTINGFIVKRVNLYNLLEIKEDVKIDLYVCSHFNENGGTFKDRLIFIENNIKEKEIIYKCHLVKVPFFDNEEKTVDIKDK